MSKAIQGLGMLGGAVAMGAAAFLNPELVASPWFDKVWASLAIGGISMEVGAIAGALSQNRGTQVTVRQSAAYRPIVYGTRQVGGSMIYASTTGSHHDQYNMVIVLAGHECEAIENLYLDGRKVFWSQGSVGNTTRNGVNFGGSSDGNTYIGPDGSHYNFGGPLVYCEARFGDQADGDVIGGLTANDPTWAANSNGSPYVGGCTYVYLKIEYDSSMFPTQPEIRFTVRGKNDIFDPRTNTTGYTTNWALCVSDVLQDLSFGTGVTQSSINTAQLIASANICDEQVALATQGSEARYTCNWTGDTGTAAGDILTKIMPAGAGRISYIAGSWFIWPGYWQGPSATFTQDDFTGPIDWNPNKSVRDMYNRVKGTYIAPWYPYSVAGNLYDQNGWYDGTIANTFNLAWQPTDYPYYAQDQGHGYSSDEWLTEDLGVIRYKDLNHEACISVATSQRLAKIELLQNRLGRGTVTLPMKIGAYRVQPLDVIQVNFPLYGWVNKLFEVQTVRFNIKADDDKGPTVTCEVDVMETDASIYTWSVTEEQTVYDVPALQVVPPYAIDPPTNLSLTGSSINFGLGSDGKGILITFTPSDDAYAVQTVVQYQASNDSNWTSAASVPQGVSITGIAPLPNGDYNVRIAASRANGALSPFVTGSVHTSS